MAALQSTLALPTCRWSSGSASSLSQAASSLRCMPARPMSARAPSCSGRSALPPLVATTSACAVSSSSSSRRRQRAALLVVARASPMDDMDREFSALDRQFQAMDKEFAAIDRQFADMGRELSQLDGFERQVEQEVDRELSSMFQRTQASLEQQQALLQQQLDRQLALQESARVQVLQGQSSVPGSVYFESVESTSAGSSAVLYRSYSLSITTGDTLPSYTTPVTAAAAPVSPLVLIAALLASAHVAIAATFVKNFHLTTYQPRSRLGLALAWPVLVIFNGSFRKQFLAALQGKRAPVLKEEGDEVQGQGTAEAR